MPLEEKFCRGVTSLMPSKVVLVIAIKVYIMIIVVFIKLLFLVKYTIYNHTNRLYSLRYSYHLFLVISKVRWVVL